MDVNKLIDDAKKGKIGEKLKEEGIVRVSTEQLAAAQTKTAIEKLGDETAEQVIRWKLEEELSYAKISERLIQQGHTNMSISLVQSFFQKYNKIKDRLMEDNNVLRRRLIRRTLKHEHKIDSMITTLIDQLNVIKADPEIDEIERTNALTTLIRTAMDAMRSDSKLLKETRTDITDKTPNLTQINITNKIGKDKEKLRAELLRADFDVEVEVIDEDKKRDSPDVQGTPVESWEAKGSSE